MSYQKISGTPNLIQFYYYVDNLYDAVNWRSLYRATRIKKQDGDDMTNEMALQEDERGSFNQICSNSLHMLFDLYAKQTGLVENAIIDNVEVETSNSTTSDVIGFYIENKSGYKYNKLDMCDKYNFEILKNDILFNWYQIIGFDDEVARVAVIKNNWLSLLKKNLIYLRIPSSY